MIKSFGSIRTLILLLAFTLGQLPSAGAQEVKKEHRTTPYKWMASFMTGGANDATTRHFIRLADGTLISFPQGGKPEPVQGINHVKAIASSSFHMLALKDDGTVWAWGDNDNGQLGQPASLKHSDKPVKVPGIGNVIDISAYRSESYALLADGTVMAWGRISHNGWSTIKKWDKPTRLAGITDGMALAGPMVLLGDGSVMAWGDGNWGQLGNGTMAANIDPVKVKGISNAVAIASGDVTRMALLEDGTIATWGSNAKGILGNGLTEIGNGEAGKYTTIPVKVKNTARAQTIAMSATCYAVLEDGTVRGWGWGEIGALGSKRYDENPLPVKIPGAQDVIAVYAISGGCFALTTDGTLMGWGAGMVPDAPYHRVLKVIELMSLGDRAPQY